MGTFTQDNRPVRASCVLGPNALLLLGFQGTEAISEPFEFVVDLLSEDPAVDGKKLLRSKFVLEVDLPNGSQRFISGHVRKFEQLGRHEQLTSYRAHIVPAMWYLKLEQDCRIFQHLSVLDIIDQVLKDAGITRVDVRCNATYTPREYCVQYRESDFNFITRLMEDEGIFYFFEHSKDGDTLVLGDVPSAFTALPNTTKVNVRVASGPMLGEDVITSISNQQEVHTGKVTLRDYDFEQPSLKLEANVKGKEPEEFYDYPGKFTKVDEGNRYARLMLEQRESLQEAIQGSSSVREFTPGYKFDLADHYRRDLNKPYVLLRVIHSCSGGDYQSWDQNAYSYSNDFVAFPSKTPFRPPSLTPRPIVHGTQSALVVGPAGEEIHVDKHGRVKVQFYWDRLGKKDDKSSCWVRCSTSWGGKGWGMISIPRIGQEVLVDFFEGDPDQPIITGRVFNAEQTPPYPLPGGMVVSGGKSQSHKGKGFNEMSMDDTAGKEKVTIHAQYDMSTTVQHDQTNTVNNKFTETIKSDASITVTEGKYSHDVAASTANYHVQGALTEKYDATQSTRVQKEITIASTAGAISISADAQHVYINAATNIQLHVGSSMIWMDSGGQINIQGANVAINGSSSVIINGGVVQSIAKGQNEMSGANVLSNGSATNVVKGGMVMLNP